MNTRDHAYIRNSSWTGRSARSMESAFGPGHRSSYGISPMPEPHKYGAAWWIAFSILAVVAVVVIVATR